MNVGQIWLLTPPFPSYYSSNMENLKEKSPNSTKTESFQQVYDKFISKAFKSEEYSTLMDPIIDKMDEDEVELINMHFLSGSDYESSFRNLTYLVADMLNIEPPRIAFKNISKEEEWNDGAAVYIPETKIIGILHKEGRAHQKTGEILSAVECVAHEMWHAYQHNEIETHGKRAPLYQENFDNYTHAYRDSPPEELLSYLEQPIEAEALVFGEKFMIKFVEKLISSLTKEQNAYLGEIAIDNTLDNMQDLDAWDIIAQEEYKEEIELKMKELKALRKFYGSYSLVNQNASNSTK